jgi:hypothetical protein
MDHAQHLGQSKTHMTNMTLFTLQSYSTFKLLNKTCTLSVFLTEVGWSVDKEKGTPSAVYWRWILVRLHYRNCNSVLCLSQFPCIVCKFVVLDSVSTYHVGFELLKAWVAVTIRVTGWNPLVKRRAPEGALYVFARIFGQPNSYQFLMKFGYCRLVKASSWNCIQLQVSEPRVVILRLDYTPPSMDEPGCNPWTLLLLTELNCSWGK